jgi:hypothetical protein
LLLEYSAEQQQLRDKQKMLKSDWEKFKQQRQQMGSRSVSYEAVISCSSLSQLPIITKYFFDIKVVFLMRRNTIMAKFLMNWKEI